MTVRCDPLCRNDLFLVTDLIDILKSTDHLVITISIGLADEGNHLSSLTVKGSLHAKLTCSNSFLLVGGRDHGCTASLADVQFYRTGFDTETATDKIFKIFAASCKHLVTESVGSYRAVIFADKSSLSVVDSLRNTDDKVAVCLECFFQIFQKSFLVKICLRKIDK